MSARANAIAIVVVVIAAVIGWHYTPWSEMAWWGKLGCYEARRATGVTPAGCENETPFRNNGEK